MTREMGSVSANATRSRSAFDSAAASFVGSTALAPNMAETQAIAHNDVTRRLMGFMIGFEIGIAWL